MPRTNEEWREIPGWPNYQVSSEGRVRSVDRQGKIGRGYGLRKGTILNQRVGRSGYPTVPLSRGSGGEWHLVSHLVALAFIGPRPEGYYVLHGDDDRFNNAADNLRYGTPSENQVDAVLNRHHVNSKKVECIRGHPLHDPNLVPSAKKKSRRQCLACQRMLSHRGRHPEWRGKEKELSDHYYERIISDQDQAVR